MTPTPGHDPAGRLDQYLVTCGLARSRGQAQELIRAGRVTVDGRVRTKPSYAVQPGAVVAGTGAQEQWVGRGARKLLRALQLWGGQGLAVRGRRCLDVGASTGGFTQVLLEHGAAHVTALDVGRGQLAERLAADPRVRDLPGTNVREITEVELGGRFDLVVADVSFVSLTLVLPYVRGLLAPHGDVVVLVKPQFEVGRERLGKGGVVRSAVDRRAALVAVAGAADGLGLAVHGLAPSGVAGTHGNVEYLLWLAAPAPGMMSVAQRAARMEEVTMEEEAR